MSYNRKLAKDYADNKNHFRSSDDLLRALLKKAGIQGKTVLDLGCGDGSECFTLFNLGAKSIAGVDNSLAMINLAKRRRIRNAKFIKTSGARLPFKDNTFGLVYSRFVLHYIKDLKAQFKEVGRVLERKGYFVAIFQTLTSDHKLENKLVPLILGKGKHQVNIKILSKNINQIKKDLKSAGFKSIKLQKVKNTDSRFNPTYKNKYSFKNSTYILLATRG